MNIIVSLVPIIALCLWVFVIYDWRMHCVNRHQYWLMVLLLTNIIGYYFFIHSPDRQ